MLIVAGILILFVSCSKENFKSTKSSTSVSILDYYPLKQGNYWVFKLSNADTSGNITSVYPLHDSIVVENDTIINSNTYHIVTEYNFVGGGNAINYIRDSANCIVNNLREILLSLDTGVFYKKIYPPDTMLYIDFSFISQLTLISVPLGTFSCVDFRGKLLRKADNYCNPHFTHSYFCKYIGSVKKIKIWSASLQQLHYELLMYHVQ